MPLNLVGETGFEPATPCSQSRCANRTALHPVVPDLRSRPYSLSQASTVPDHGRGNLSIPGCKDSGFFPFRQTFSGEKGRADHRRNQRQVLLVVKTGLAAARSKDRSATPIQKNPFAQAQAVIGEICGRHIFNREDRIGCCAVQRPLRDADPEEPLCAGTSPLINRPATIIQNPTSPT